MDRTLLTKTLTTKHIWAIAIGMVISGQYFGWNYGFRAAGVHGMFIATLVVSIFYLCFMLCYAELAAMMPKAGGPLAYATQAFGRRMGFITGLACCVELIFAAPAIAVATGAYLHFLVPIIPPHLASVLIFLGCILINLSGTRDLALFEMAITLLALLGLIIYYAANTAYTNPVHHLQLAQQHASWTKAIPFAIWLYLAIEGVAMTAEEVMRPHKDIARGFILAIITVCACSALTLFFTEIHNTNPSAAIDYPLSATLAQLYNSSSWLARSVDILGLCGLLASLNGIIIAYTRQVFALSRAHFLPKIFTRLTKNNTPIWALIIPSSIGIVATYSAKFANQLIMAAAFGALCMYCLVLISYFKLRHTQPSHPRPYHAPYPWTAAIALGLGLFFLFLVTV